jgi:myosin heavy subunit
MRGFAAGLFIHGARRTARASGGAVVAAVGLLVTACPDKQGQIEDAAGTGGVEDLTIVVEADKSRILEQEESLRKSQEQMRAEQERLASARDSIAKQLETISKKDRKQRIKLEDEESRVEQEERKLREKLKSFDSEKAKLEREKTDLLERISALTKGNIGGGGASIEQREARLAQREQELARREARVTDRQKEVQQLHTEAEKSLLQINRILAELQGGGITRTVVVNTTTPMPAGSDPSAVKIQAAKLSKAVQTKMDAKGILVADLPPTARDQQANATKALGAKDFETAVAAFTELDQVVTNIKVDHAFVQAKFRRIGKDYESRMKDLDEKRKSRVLALLDEVSDSFSDGRYDRANRKINQIHDVLEGR